MIALVALFSPACASFSNSNVAVWYRNTPSPVASPAAEATTASPLPSPAPSPTIVSSPAPEPTASVEPSASASPVDDPFVKGGNLDAGDNSEIKENNNTAVVTPSGTLMIPVVGIKREDLRDTFDDARSEGRVHDAIDIIAAGGTPVVAAIDGKIIKFFDSEKGGVTIYQLGPDEHTVYYYAHLQRRANDLQEGVLVKQGTLLGFVGDTGNAGPGNYHLHFAIWTIAEPKHFYDGTNLNPYPLLKQGIIKPQ